MQQELFWPGDSVQKWAWCLTFILYIYIFVPSSQFSPPFYSWQLLRQILGSFSGKVFQKLFAIASLLDLNVCDWFKVTQLVFLPKVGLELADP